MYNVHSNDQILVAGLPNVMISHVNRVHTTALKEQENKTPSTLSMQLDKRLVVEFYEKQVTLRNSSSALKLICI